MTSERKWEAVNKAVKRNRSHRRRKVQGREREKMEGGKPFRGNQKGVAGVNLV